MVLEVRIIDQEGIEAAIDAVTPHFFHGNRDAASAGFAGHAQGAASTLLAYTAEELIGILTLRWISDYPPFAKQGIPSIYHLEIRWDRRGEGLGNELVEQAEQYVRRRAGRLGTWVGLLGGYGPVQRLFVKRGYVPDGSGACWGHSPLREGEQITLTEDVVLWLIKDLDPSAPRPRKGGFSGRFVRSIDPKIATSGEDFYQSEGSSPDESGEESPPGEPGMRSQEGTDPLALPGRTETLRHLAEEPLSAEARSIARILVEGLPGFRIRRSETIGFFPWWITCSEWPEWVLGETLEATLLKARTAMLGKKLTGGGLFRRE